jgi:serine/threonine protein kinase
MPFYPTTFQELVDREDQPLTLEICLQTMFRLTTGVDFLHRNGFIHGRISLDHILAEFENGQIVRSALTGLWHCQPFDSDLAENDIRALSSCFLAMVPQHYCTHDFLELVYEMNPPSRDVELPSLGDVIGHPIFAHFVEAGKIDSILGDPQTDLQFIGRSPRGTDRTIWHLGRCLGEPGDYVKVVQGWCDEEGPSHPYALKIASKFLQQLTQYQLSLRLADKLVGHCDPLVVSRTRFVPRRRIGNSIEKLDATVIVYDLYASDLRLWVQDRGIRDGKTIKNLMFQMASCVIMLHNYGLIHNAIHLDNFFVQPVAGGDVKVYLGGWSRLMMSDDVYVTRFPVREGEGTEYMAPELIELRICSFETDRFALGRCFQILLVDAEQEVQQEMADFVSHLMQEDPDNRMSHSQLLESPLIGRRIGITDRGVQYLDAFQAREPYEEDPPGI